MTGAFKLSPEDKAMSVDWCRYSTANRLQRSGRKPASEYYVLGGKVGAIRAIPNLVVEHSPQPAMGQFGENRAHASVMTEPRDAPENVWSEVRLRVADAFRKILDPEEGDSVPLTGSEDGGADCAESLCQLSLT